MRLLASVALALGYCACAIGGADPLLDPKEKCVDVVDLETPPAPDAGEGHADAAGTVRKKIDAYARGIRGRNQAQLHDVISKPASRKKKKPGGDSDEENQDRTDVTANEKSFAKRVNAVNTLNTDELRTLTRLRNWVVDHVPESSCLRQEADRKLGMAVDEARYSAGLASHMSQQYGLYIGPNYSLGGDGTWRVGAETLVRFDTEVFTVHDQGYEFLKPLVPDSGWMRGYAEISYQAINALQDDTGTAVPSDDVFSSTGGYLRINTGMQIHWTDWWGVQFGGGVSSLPNNENITRLEPRGFAGLHFQTIYNDGALGTLFIGGAYDKFWRSEVFNDPANPLAGTHTEKHFGRYNIDGLLFLPGEAMNFHLVTRLFADGPLDGKGPSDVRVSILLYYDFNSWLGTFLPIKKAKDAADAVTGL